MTYRTVLMSLAIVLPALAATAHEVAKGPNGGEIVDIEGHHLEFTHAAGEVIIYTTDEAHKPLPTAGSTGRLMVQSGGKVAQAELKAAEPNKLVAKLDAQLAQGAVVVVSTTFSDGHKAQARFIVN